MYPGNPQSVKELHRGKRRQSSGFTLRVCVCIVCALHFFESSVLGRIDNRKHTYKHIIVSIASGRSKAMASWCGREALRGVEVQTLDLIAQVLTPKHWAELLKGPLERAASTGRRGLVLRLAEAGAQIGDALHAAVLGGHRGVVNDLLDNGASINAKHTKHGTSPLHVAAGEGDWKMVELLMVEGAYINALDKYAFTPLHTAGHYGQVAAARALLAGGANVNLRCGQDKRSVVHMAAEQGHVAILRAAIEHGANVSTADRHRNTALHAGAISDEARAIDVLVSAGADIEARDDHDHTPLHAAAVRPNLKTLSALLEHGAHVNARDSDLQTPLHYAAARVGEEEGAAKVVDLLLRSGADETIADNEGNTAAGVVVEDIEEWEPLFEDVVRVRELLANAPADRVWRRRGYLVLCRAYQDRVQLAQRSSSTHDGTERSTLQTAKSGRSEASRCPENVRGTRHEGSGADWMGVVARVLGLHEEGIFRKIVGYL